MQYLFAPAVAYVFTRVGLLFGEKTVSIDSNDFKQNGGVKIEYQNYVLCEHTKIVENAAAHAKYDIWSIRPIKFDIKGKPEKAMNLIFRGRTDLGKL